MQSVGELGEKLVALWLEFKGYEILQQRWRCRWGEIDVIAQKKSNSTLVFVEVKTRSSRNWDNDGMLAVNWQKQQKIAKTATMFFVQYPNLADFPCRFDVALVSYQSLNNRSPILLTENNYTFQLEQEQPTLRDQKHQVMLKEYLKSAFDL